MLPPRLSSWINTAGTTRHTRCASSQFRVAHGAQPRHADRSDGCGQCGQFVPAELEGRSREVLLEMVAP